MATNHSWGMAVIFLSADSLQVTPAYQTELNAWLQWAPEFAIPGWMESSEVA